MLRGTVPGGTSTGWGRSAGEYVLEQGDPNILVIGSQSVLATFNEDEFPDWATASKEVDLAHFDDPTGDKADAVDGARRRIERDPEFGPLLADRGSTCAAAARPAAG